MHLELTKTDVALRQLNAAIKMYFHDEDHVSIHTLSMAAYNVFDDLYAANHGEKWFTQTVEMCIHEDKQKFFTTKIREAHNFFKHADRDNKSTISWDTENAFMGIFMAMMVALQLKVTSPQIRLFMSFSVAKYPDMWVVEKLLPVALSKDIPNVNNYTPTDLRTLYDTIIPTLVHTTIDGQCSGDS